MRDTHNPASNISSSQELDNWNTNTHDSDFEKDFKTCCSLSNCLVVRADDEGP